MPETQKSLTQLVLLPQTSSNETATNAPVSFEEQVERNSEVQQTVEYNKDSAPTVSTSGRTILNSDHPQPSSLFRQWVRKGQTESS